MKRSRWVAGFLSVPVCGLGHLYVGAWRRGGAFLVGELCIQVAALMAIMHVRSTPLNLIASVAPVVGYNVWAIVDAVRSTRQSVAFRAPWFVRWLVYVGLWWGIVNWGQLYVAYGVRATMAEAFYLPTGAMSDTLIRGDSFLIDKLPRSAPRRGEVVTFRHDSEIWVKRVIGLPGERLEIRDGLVHINDQPLDEPYLRLEGCRQWDFKAVVRTPGSLLRDG